jgi:adenosylcobinamide-GDP ribazoletransferase
MNKILNAFYFALSYFSIIPVFVKNMEINNETYKYTLALLPLVGAILASVVILLNLGLVELFNPLYASFICAVVYLALYGFLHLEAVCDVVDAWFASHGGKDPYKIMKEPTIGAIGALYAFSFVLLKVAAITYLLYEEQYMLFFIICIFSRLNFIYLLGYFKFSKDSFLSLAFADAGVFKVKLYSLVYILIAFFIVPNSLILLFVSLLSFFIILRTLNKQFGFVNGDCLGFTLEHVELILLNFALVLVV